MLASSAIRDLVETQTPGSSPPSECPEGSASSRTLAVPVQGRAPPFGSWGGGTIDDVGAVPSAGIGPPWGSCGHGMRMFTCVT